ncbi:MAG: hypothetical protein U0892_07575 [Pirellulales bacterium]
MQLLLRRRRSLPAQPARPPDQAHKVEDETQRMVLKPDPNEPFVGMAFKIVEDPYGQLTFMRITKARLSKVEMYTNQRTGRKERFSRIVRMHADKREIDSAEGDIVAIMSIDCALR